MTPEETIIAQVKEAIEKKGFTDKAAVEAIVTEALKNYKPESAEKVTELENQLKEVKDAAVKQGEEMNKIKNAAPAGNLPSMKEGIRQVLAKTVEGKSEAQIRDMIKSGDLTITIRKTAGVMEVSTNVTGNDVGRVRVNPVWDIAPRRMPFVRDIIGFSSTNSPTERVVEMLNEDGDAAWTAEGALKPLVDFDLKTTDYTSKEVSAATQVSEKMLFDIDRLMGEIEKKIISLVDLKEENGILFGTGTGNDPVGVTEVASAYVLDGISVVEPNNYDAIVAAYTQLISLEHNPNACYVNPIDWANMKLRKDANNQYVVNLPGQVIDGLPIIPKNQIPVGYFLIGDFTKATGLDYKALEIVPGYEGDNFRKAIVTLRGIKEIIFYVPTNQHNAFVYDQFSVVKEDIAEVVA